MTIILCAVALTFLMLFNLWAKSLFIGIAVLLLAVFITLNLDSTNHMQIYAMAAGYLVIAWSAFYMMFKVENL